MNDNNFYGTIYCFTNKVNGKKYVGQTRNGVDRRAYEHQRSAKTPSDSSYDQVFHRAIRKYGWDNFILTVLADNIDNQEDLDYLEDYFIQYYQTLTPQHGYNARTGGRYYSLISPESIHKMCMAKGELTEEEVIELRIAYKNHESPKKIYEEKYKDRLEFHAFMNIWSGRRYKQILPEYIQNGRRKKYSDELVAQIQKDYFENHLSYKELSKKYNVPKNSIGNFIHGHRKPKKEPVTTIPESGE